MGFDKQKIYKLKSYDDCIQNDRIIDKLDNDIPKEIFDKKVGQLFFHSKDDVSYNLYINFINQELTTMPKDFTVPEPDAVIKQFISDDNFGIHVQSDYEFYKLNDIKLKLKLEKSRESHKDQYLQKLVIYNDNTYSSLDYARDKINRYYIPFELFLEYYNKSSYINDKHKEKIQPNTVYRIKTVKELLDSGYIKDKHNEIDCNGILFTQSMNNTSNMMVYSNDSTDNIFFKNKFYSIDMLQKLSSKEIVNKFKSDKYFGIQAVNQDELNKVNQIKEELGLKSSSVANSINSDGGTLIQNNGLSGSFNSHQETSTSYYGIPLKLFNQHYQNTKGNKMLQNFTKEFLLQQNEEYFIKIHNLESQTQIEKLFNDNGISYNLFTKFNDSFGNFYITNNSTWSDDDSVGDNVIEDSEWIKTISGKRETLIKFEPGKLYRVRTYDDLEEEFGLIRNSDTIDVSESFPITMRDDIKLQNFFEFTNDHSDNNYIFKSTSDTWSISPEMCYEVTNEEFFTKLYSKETKDTLRFKVGSLSSDKGIRRLLSQFNLELTEKFAFDIEGENSYYTTIGTYGSANNAVEYEYKLISLDIFKSYANEFMDQIVKRSYPILDISTMYGSDKSRLDIILDNIKIRRNALTETNRSNLILLPNNNFLVSKERTRSARHDTSSQNEFFNIAKKQSAISTKDMLRELFNNIGIKLDDSDLPADIHSCLKIKDLIFQQVMKGLEDHQVDISIQSKKQFEELIQIFKEYGVPYKKFPIFKRGIKLSTSEANGYTRIESPYITFNDFKKLQEDNESVFVSDTNVKKEMKQFYLKKIEYKHYHNDEKACEIYLATQGNINIEEISGSASRYFTAKELGISHDGLTEKSKRVMDEILNELDSPESIADSEWILLIGNSGSGKTTIAKKYFTDKGQKYIKVQGHARLSADDILGYESIVDHTYNPSKLRICVEKGWGYILDEGHTCDPNTLMVYNGLKDGLMEFPDKTVEVHPDFRFIVTANSIEFSEKYNSANKWDHAFKSRFSEIEYNLTKLDLGERYGAKYIKQIEDVMNLDPREIQRKVRHIKQAEQKQIIEG